MSQVNVEVTKKHSKETFESLMRRFKKKVKISGILNDIKKNEYYVKPSMRKRENKRKRR